VFRPLDRALADRIRVVPVTLPGHGARFGEPLLWQVEDLVEDVLGGLEQQADACPRALLGYSFGALLAFEVALRLEARKHAPLVVFVVGAEALTRVPPQLHLLSNEDLVSAVFRFGGMPEVVYRDADARALFAPILRADLRARERYEYSPAKRLTSAVVAIRADGDPLVSRSGVAEWAQLADVVTTLEISGGHFSALERPHELARIVECEIASRLLPSSS
jgi:surfactin synthase thioesterase subunit